jgi:hypothetical protein
MDGTMTKNEFRNKSEVLQRPAREKAHMNKNKMAENRSAAITTPAPQAKRYDAAFKQQAVEPWIKSGKLGTQIAAELGISHPSLKDWKRRYTGMPCRCGPIW